MFQLPIQKEYPVVSVNDPSVDKEKSNIDKYQETLDQKHLVVNGTPTVFWLKPLSLSQHLELVGAAAQIQEKEYADSFKVSALGVSYSLVKVEGLQGFTLERQDDKVTDECMERLWSVNSGLIFELSSYVREVSQSPLVIGPE